MPDNDGMNGTETRFKKLGTRSQRVFKAAVSTQREAFDVLRRNGRTLVNTEIGASKNLASAVRASARKVRGDGLRRVAENPRKYVPNGRRQIVAAFRDSVGLVWRTGGELGRVVSNGYASVVSEADPTTGSESKAESKAPRKTTASAANARTARARKRTAQSTTAAAGSRKPASRRSQTTRKQSSSQPAADTTAGATTSTSASNAGERNARTIESTTRDTAAAPSQPDDKRDEAGPSGAKPSTSSDEDRGPNQE